MRDIRVALGDRSYRIKISSGLLDLTGETIRELDLGVQALVVSDRTVSSVYGERILRSLKSAGIDAALAVVPDGEESKSLDQLSKLYTHFIESGLRRDGLVIALGGGVVGDLAGFAAATYLRGVGFVQIPTSLLAQVDSSVGGKVGVNHVLGKNLIGSFHQPVFVLIDPETLTTLSGRELWAGLGEVVKYGLIRDGDFFDWLETRIGRIAKLADLGDAEEAVARCVAIKAGVVVLDEKENDLRRILNFGHTLGHALEAVTDYSYFKHGEAVVHGMSWAVWMSHEMGFLDAVSLSRIQTLLNRFPIPAIPASFGADLLSAKIKIDKKQTAKGLALVLLDSIGKTRIESSGDLEPFIQKWLNHVRT